MKIFYVILIILFWGCNEDPLESYVITQNSRTYIKLKSQRSMMVHDPVSILLNKKYNDSELIEIPYFKYGLIKGEDILTEKGYYKYSGNIEIKQNKITINLLIKNTDRNTLEQFSWNGEYNYNK